MDTSNQPEGTSTSTSTSTSSNLSTSDRSVVNEMRSNQRLPLSLRALLDSNKTQLFLEQPSLYNILNYGVSLGIVTSGWRTLTGKHWNLILPVSNDNGALVLSALPIETQLPWWLGGAGGHHLKLIKQFEPWGGLGLVVSMNREFELYGTGLPIYPVSPLTWHQHGVKQIIQPMEDFTNQISLPELKKVVDRVHIARTRGVRQPDNKFKKGVVVHCKAGVGRSMLVVLCYLMRHQGKTLEDAEKHLRACRPEVAINEGKREMARAFIERYPAAQTISPEESEQLFQELSLHQPKQADTVLMRSLVIADPHSPRVPDRQANRRNSL